MAGINDQSVTGVTGVTGVVFSPVMSIIFTDTGLKDLAGSQASEASLRAPERRILARHRQLEHHGIGHRRRLHGQNDPQRPGSRSDASQRILARQEMSWNKDLDPGGQIVRFARFETSK